MPQSLSQLYVHIVFHVRYRETSIRPNNAEELYAYMGGVVKNLQSHPVRIGGMPDHIHILCSLSKNVSLAKLVEEIKRSSSRWIKTKGDYYRKFAWQGGYSAFSVSSSVLEKTCKYIENQAIYHKRRSFKEELVAFLKEYNISYDERYLWSD